MKDISDYRINGFSKFISSIENQFGLESKKAKTTSRYFQIAGITIRLESELDLKKVSFKKELDLFSVEEPSQDLISFRHFFEIPDLSNVSMGDEVYSKPPWAIYKNKGLLIYKGIMPDKSKEKLHRFAIFKHNYEYGAIYNPPKYLNIIQKSNWYALSLFPTDQIWLCPILADRDAVLQHSAGAILNNKGFVFVGHSTAGKSTMMELIKQNNIKFGYDFEILCDDRNIIRKWPEEWRVHGTWSHGTTSDVSPSSAPLQAICFLKKSTNNKLIRIHDKKSIWKVLLATLVRAQVTSEWWEKEINILEKLIEEIPIYIMEFDLSGKIVQELSKITL